MNNCLAKEASSTLGPSGIGGRVAQDQAARGQTFSETIPALFRPIHHALGQAS